MKLFYWLSVKCAVAGLTTGAEIAFEIAIHHPVVTRCSRLLRGQFCPKIKSVAIDIKLSPSDRVSAAAAAAAVLPLPRLNELAKIDNTASIRLRDENRAPLCTGIVYTLKNSL